MENDSSHQVKAMKMLYAIHQLRHNPGERLPHYHRERFLDYLKTNFEHQFKHLKEVYPYLKYTSFHFYRNVKRTVTIDVSEIDEFLGWLAFMPDVLKDHEFASAKHVAFAINLKNIYDNQMHEQYVFEERLTDVLFLPQGSNELVNVCDGVNYRFMDVGRVVRNGDYSFMRMMVKYGVVRPAFQKSSSYILKDHIMWLAKTDRMPPQSEFWRRIENGAKTAAHRLLAYDEEKDRGREAKLLRLQTVANAIQILNKLDPESQKLEQYEKTVACIRLYFEAIPEPFVSLLEIYQLLESADETTGYHSMSRKAESVNRYRDVFPDCDGLRPRTLKHLSRCTLRESLCKRGQLPAVISKLPVPQSIRDYIQIV